MTLRIFLADLTHDTVGLATEGFPLNIGFVGAYCKEWFGDTIDVTWFKYVRDREEAIYHTPPDILALGNCAWSHNVSMAMLRLLNSHRPEALRVLGGPNFPHDPKQQQDFLATRPLVDVYPSSMARLISQILSTSPSVRKTSKMHASLLGLNQCQVVFS